MKEKVALLDMLDQIIPYKKQKENLTRIPQSA